MPGRGRAEAPDGCERREFVEPTAVLYIEVRFLIPGFAKSFTRHARNVERHMLIPLLTEYEKEHIAERQPLPERYLGLSDEEMDRRIAAAKATLGRRLVILGHHYQRDEVIKFADYTGDSYKLARQVSQHPDAEFIVFCGVHFMAESADVLSAPHQQVILPDLAAGCSMADMAEPDQLEHVLGRSRADGRRRRSGASRQSFRSPTSTPPRRSKRSAASTAASSAPRRTRRRR